MPFPNYENSIVNLSCTLKENLGATNNGAYKTLSTLGDQLDPEKSTILLIIDGLSYNFVTQHAAKSFFSKHVVSQLDSVFPSTTASAITTYMSGVSPKEHGLTGWFTYFKEIDQVGAILPYRSRGEWLDLEDKLGDSPLLFPKQNFFRDVDRECHMVMPETLVNSRYSRHFYTDVSQTLAFSGLENMFDKLRQLQSATKKFVYCYWPEFDATAHEFGVESEETRNHFEEIDRYIRLFAEDLVNSQLVICADHGFIDTETHKVIYIDEHPQMHDCLNQSLCGEPRTVFCYVRPDKVSFFENYVSTKLSDVCQLQRSEDLLNSGRFGRGIGHNQIANRIGTHTLLMKDNYVMVEQLEGESNFAMIGVHGGISEKEMQVPLFYYSK